MVPGNDGAPKALRAALIEDYQITQPSKQFIQAHRGAGRGGGGFAAGVAWTRCASMILEEYLWGLEYIDFLHGHSEHPLYPRGVREAAAEAPAAALLNCVQPEGVSEGGASDHRGCEYESHGRNRKGVASTFLAERVGESDRVPVFVHSAKGFRLPEDGNTPIIMVGPGTGVAPFRAYLQDRKATGAKGKNWLFFGEQRRASDFLYEEEFAAMQGEGVLTRFDTAFSRDQAHKVYVQNRMMENAAEIWKWVDQEGAHFFVCGDASRMAKDVDAALLKIVETEGGKTPDEAALYVEDLKKTKRYKRDVY